MLYHSSQQRDLPPDVISFQRKTQVHTHSHLACLDLRYLTSSSNCLMRNASSANRAASATASYSSSLNTAESTNMSNRRRQREGPIDHLIVILKQYKPPVFSSGLLLQLARETKSGGVKNSCISLGHTHYPTGCLMMPRHKHAGQEFRIKGTLSYLIQQRPILTQRLSSLTCVPRAALPITR